MGYKIQRNTRLLPILIAVLIFMQLIDPYRGWAMLLVGVGGAWLACYLWARTLGNKLVLRREMRFGWAQVGDRLEERFTIVNQSWLPVPWVEVIDHSTLPDYQPSRVTGVDGYSENRWRTQGICTHRGLFRLGPTDLKTGDPLGFYTVCIHDLASVDLLVMPPILSLPFIEVAPGGRAGEGRPRHNAPERTVSASTVRAYHPGEELRWIHWRTSARYGELFIRLFDSTPSSDWWVVLDLEKSVQAGKGLESTEEHGIILAASLADQGLRLGNSVGFITHGERLAWLPPQEGTQRRWEILRALALASPGSCSLAELLAHAAHSIKQRVSLVIITPNVAGDWLEALLPLMWRGAVPTVLLLDPGSFGGEVDGTEIMAALAEWGIKRYRITRQVFDRPEARPGQAGKWEWRVTPSGRAVPIRRPRDLDWKVLG